MAKTFMVEVEVPHGLKAGDRFAVSVEVPAAPRVRKTKLADIPLSQLTLGQLRTERTNARSVLYKATRRGDDKAILEATKRVNRVAAEIAKRTGKTLYEEINAPAGLFEDEDALA
nr:MAG TPA: Alpha-2-macroglobulin family [Caudoviricetes sp.]